MRNFLIAALSAVAVFYFFLAEVGSPVDEAAFDTAVEQPGAGSGARLPDRPLKEFPIHSDSLARPGDPQPLTPLRMPDTGGQTPPHSSGFAGLPATSGRKTAPAAEGDQRTATLWRLADLNMDQFYAVLWHTLEAEELDDREFREFVLATLDEVGDHTPGEILAALVQTAPTPAHRLGALQLLAEASQELSVDPFKQALEDQDPAIRRTALAFFDGLSANALLEAVADAVLDGNRVVRLNAFSTMEDMHQFAPVWNVADLVADDPDPQIRMRALELLTYGDREAAIDRLVLALGDPNPQVSELAEALLTEFEQDPS